MRLEMLRLLGPQLCLVPTACLLENIGGVIIKAFSYFYVDEGTLLLSQLQEACHGACLTGRVVEMLNNG